MRRLVSIAAVLALLFGMMSPVLAAACTGTGKAASCHTAPVAHYERAAHEHHHHAAMPPPTDSVSAADCDSQCPMDCCRPGNRQSVTTTATAPLLPPLAVSDQSFNYTSVTFTSAGFSSHTDRGPPLA